jgi:hypothetical protein
MKMMVKLAVFLATLLLLTGGAFAQGVCNCYDVTALNLDSYGYFPNMYVALCFDSNNKTGEIHSLEGNGDMSLFFDDPVQALGEVQGCVAYAKFHDTRLTVFKSIGFCDGDRWMLWGRKTDMDNCVHGM